LSLSQTEGGANEFRRFIVYLAAVQDREVIEMFREALRRHGLERGGEIMTYAEELLAEGRAEGEARKQIEMIEGFLRVGVTWEVIEAATGLNEAQFRALKTQLAAGDS